VKSIRVRGPGIAGGGAILFAGAAGWATLTGWFADSSAVPVAGLIVVVGLSVAISWVVARHRPALMPAGIVGAALALAFAEAGSTFHISNFHGPLGYANASAAFFGQASVAALLLIAVGRSQALRVAGIAALVVFTPIMLFAQTWSVAILLPGILLASTIVARLRGRRAAAVVCGAVFVAVLFASLAAGAIGVPDGQEGDALFGATVRIALWHEALVIAAAEPVLGVGPGRFAEVSPTASRDPDLRWAHNEFLQAAAEMGLPGYLLVVSLFLWGFVALWAGGSGVGTVLGAAGLAVLGAHASVDYILHFPAVAIAGGALLGAALGAQAPRRGARTVPVPVRESVRELV
jgi:O-antigen ligase